MVARVFGDALKGIWNQNVITENRPGADGGLAVGALKETAALETGQVLLVAPTTILTVAPILRANLSFDPVNDALPISGGATDFLGIAVPSSSSIHSLDDLVRAAIVSPGRLNWYAAPGGPFMVFTDWMRRRSAQMTFISYRGAPDAVRDLSQDRIQVVMAPLTPLLPLISAGSIRLVVVSNPERSPRAAAVPTAQEAGHPELTLEGFISFFAPRTASLDQRRRIAGDIATASADPQVVDRLRNAGLVVRSTSPTELADYVRQQAERWRRLAQDLDIRPS